MKIGSLFSGIGGLDLGLERAGMEVVWQVEKDDYANRVLEKHWPNVKRFQDVRECGSHNLETVDLICGGFPCQPHSLAGKRKASLDDRDLWGQFARIVRELKPRWVVAENVPGLLSSESGRFFGRVLRDLAESRYDAEWDCIPAVAFGAPHIRYRVFIVAYPHGTRRGLQPIIFQKREDPPRAFHDGAEELMADSNQFTKRRLSFREKQKNAIACLSSKSVCDASSSGFQNRTDVEMERPQSQSEFERSDWWSIEPDVGRLAHGIPSRVDRLRCLGNAVVPQVAEWIGKRILESIDKKL